MWFEVENVLLRTLWVKRNVGKGTPTKSIIYSRFEKSERFPYEKVNILHGVILWQKTIWKSLCTRF